MAEEIEQNNHRERLSKARESTPDSLGVTNIGSAEGAIEYMGQKITTDTELPDSPNLPIIMLLLAVAKDGIDIGLTVLALMTGGILLPLTIIFGIVISVMFGLIIGIWVSQKVGIIRKLLFKRVIIRIISLMLLGSIPGLKLFPEAIILVLLTYSNEFKIVSDIFDSLQKATGKIKLT